MVKDVPGACEPVPERIRHIGVVRRGLNFTQRGNMRRTIITLGLLLFPIAACSSDNDEYRSSSAPYSSSSATPPGSSYGTASTASTTMPTAPPEAGQAGQSSQQARANIARQPEIGRAHV